MGVIVHDNVSKLFLDSILDVSKVIKTKNFGNGHFMTVFVN